MTQPGGSGDLIGDFQRWLLRSGARGMSRELADQVRAALGKNQSTGDVWETATTQPVPADAPECAWCPLCRAARIVREAKPGRDKRVAAVGDALTTVVQDAVSVLEAALAATGRSAGGNGRTEAGPGTRGYPAAGAAGKAARAQGDQATTPASGGGATAPPAGGQPTTPSPRGQAAAPAGGAPTAAPGSGGQAAGPSGQAPASADGPAVPGTDGPAAPGTDGSAAPGTNGPAAPEPPEESPHEPDDRG